MSKMKTSDYRSASRALQVHRDPRKAATYRGYFKDTTGETFLGVTTPILRRLAKEFQAMPLADVRQLMKSTVHEQRSLAMEILRLKFQKAAPEGQEQVFLFYIKNRTLISSWDCVDGSAPYIVGRHLLKRDKKLLYRLAVSARIWDRRIAIVSSLWFIRHGNVRDTVKLARILLQDKEDLIHKASGWMLREVGKRDIAALKKFLHDHGPIMPRTMLRYAIERFPEAERKKYLSRE